MEIEKEVHVLDTDRISLSLSTIQNRIAVTIATLLSIEQLLDLELDQLSCPMEATAHTPCGLMFYNKKYDDGKEFDMKCEINVNSVPPVHYLRIKISNGKLYDIQFKCNPDSNNNLHITKTIAKAINYSNYRDITDSVYNIHHILHNFTDAFYSQCKDIHGMEKMAKYLMDIQKNTDTSDNIEDLECTIEGEDSTFIITSPHIGIFKFIVESGGNNFYCYFAKNIIGIDSLILCINSVINRIKLSITDNGL